MKKMKIFCVGAGAVASSLCRCLAKEKIITEIVCASNDPLKAKEFIKASKKIKLLQKKIDASNTNQIAKAAKGFDLIINASLANFNESVMKAALRARANYLDLCSYFPVNDYTVEQLKYKNIFKKAGLIALINAGIAPGITNILAAEGKDKFKTVESIKIRAVEEQRASRLIFAWSPEMALYELMSKALSYKNGRFVSSAAFSGAQDYEFPDPIGKRRVVDIFADEVATIPKYIKCKHVDCKVCGTDVEFAGALQRLGFFSQKPICFRNQKIVPLDFFVQIAPPVPTPDEMVKMVKEGIIEEAIYIAVVEIAGIQEGKKTIMKNTVIFPNLNEITKRMPGATYISYPTAVAVASFIKVLPKINSCGVFPPEALNSKIRRDILIELEGYGITVRQEFSRV